MNKFFSNPKEPLKEILKQKYHYTEISFEKLDTLYKLVYADYFSKQFLNRVIFKDPAGEALAIILSIFTIITTIYPDLKILNQDLVTLLAGASVIIATLIDIITLHMILYIHLGGVKDFKIIIKYSEKVKKIEMGKERLEYIKEQPRNKLLSLFIASTVVLILSMPFLVNPQKAWLPLQSLAYLIKETIPYKTHAYKILVSAINILYILIMFPSLYSLFNACRKKENFESYLKIYLAELILVKICIAKKLGEEIEPEIYAQQNLERWLINMHLKQK